MDIDPATPHRLPSTPPLSSSTTSPAHASASAPDAGPQPGGGGRVWWFDDGNVVLVAEDTLFRVHRGVLAHQSVVFRDMFMIPLPGEYEQVEGCPVVRVTDGRRELGVLLGVLYEAHKYFKSDVALSLFEVSAMLRLGTKYQVDHVREEALARLRRCFPRTLAAFPARNVYLHDPGFSLSDGIRLRKQDAIGVVNLARAFDLDALLPPAFYVCAQLEYDELVDGVADECGSTMRLASHDLKACLRGRAALAKADVRSLRPLFFPAASPACKQPAACVEVKRELVQELWYENLANPNALVEATHWLKAYAEGRQNPLCPACVEELMEAYDVQRQQTWDSLGVFFGVAPWPLLPEA